MSDNSLETDLLYLYSRALTYVLCGQMTRAKDIIQYLQGVEKQVNARIDQANAKESTCEQ